MRWCSWTSGEYGGAGRLGALRDRDGEEWLLDVASWAASREATAPADLVDLVEASEATQRRIADLVASAKPDSPGWLRVGAVRLLAPLRAPNSVRHFRAYGDAPIPVFYKGNRRSIAGDGDDVRRPSYAEHLDYEIAVAAVVGRAARDLTEDEARAAVFGYLVVNDWAARDVERDETACLLGPGKARDFATSFGPVLVTPDEWDPDAGHEMTVSVDGEVWSRGSSAGRRWTFAQLLAHASRDEDLYPTDVLGSGTFPGGSGAEAGRRLSPGQTVTLAVAGLGSLTNRIAG
jgi:2-keto-4-pentenoate hydratase/2-oxohepta-3-ene-1,7-dioic acid hydratase in catechol pathway